MLPNNVALPHNGPPALTCLCGKNMHHATWTELALEGGTRPYTGVACNTDGCPGNFPQFWKKIIEEKRSAGFSVPDGTIYRTYGDVVNPPSEEEIQRRIDAANEARGHGEAKAG